MRNRAINHRWACLGLLILFQSGLLVAEDWFERALPNSTLVPLAADRVKNEPASVWVEFGQLALEHKPLDLGQGFPDFAAPEYLVEALHNATNVTEPANVPNHQYTRSFGHPALVNALQAFYNKIRKFSELKDPKDEILVTVGAYEALYTAVMAFVNPGDEVIIIEPAFDAYAPMVAMAGGRSVFVPLRNLTQPSPLAARYYGSALDFTLNMTELAGKISSKTRAIILNTPHNPMGKVFRKKELKLLAEFCINHNLLVIADEVYEHLAFYRDAMVSIAQMPGMWQRTVTIGSAGKTFSVTGWKVGWAFGPAHLIRYMQLVHQTAVYTVATPLQEALARAIKNETDRADPSLHNGWTMFNYWDDLKVEVFRKQDRMVRILRRARMTPIAPHGGYFLLANFTSLAQLFPEYAVLGQANGSQAINTNDYKFARWLSKEKHLQGIPGSAFYSEEHKHLGKDFIRLCYIKKNETLDAFEELIDRMLAERLGDPATTPVQGAGPSGASTSTPTPASKPPQ